MKENRVVIAIPSGQTWDAQFAMSVVFLSNHVASHFKINDLPTAFRVHNKKGSILPTMRQSLIEQALKGKATHLLFIDSDQTFPETTLHRMMAHKKGVVACNIATKSFPTNCTARKYDESGELIPVYTREDSTGLEEVDFVGTGIMLIDMKVFKRERLCPAPWFNMEWNVELGHYTGEDWYFCECMREAGVKIFIDHDLSKEVTHRGVMDYTIDMVVTPEELKHVSGGN